MEGWDQVHQGEGGEEGGGQGRVTRGTIEINRKHLDLSNSETVEKSHHPSPTSPASKGRRDGPIKPPR